ncbi:hypothetical protein [Roseomonas mucosa]|uniref:hypothetical protein n=1 Tax=Roseomonas mucosa TaxID=207340 RepID=UPI0028CD1A4A|nr:hypothetical protein [Roseomonas mucosa]MDT8350958.1 hypothetical protein [Roseomonas mucosa]
MSQANQNIATAAASDKAAATDTAMGNAMKAAAPRKTAKGKAKPDAKAAPASAPAQQPARRPAPEQRGPVTFAMAEALCPHQGLANTIARTFALSPIDMHSVRVATDQSIREGAEVLTDALNEKALAMHLQRVVGSYVGSAYGAGNFYSQKVTQARDLTAKMAAEGEHDRDLTGRDLGFDGRAQRARQFAAEMCMQAAALIAAAQGALDAYEHLTGEAWKPYDTRRQDNTQAVSRRAASEEMNAFGG